MRYNRISFILFYFTQIWLGSSELLWKDWILWTAEIIIQLYLASRGCPLHFSLVRDSVLTGDKRVLDQSLYLVSMLWVALGKTSTAGHRKGLFWSWHIVLRGQSHLENFEKLVHHLILLHVSKVRDLHFRMVLLLLLEYGKTICTEEYIYGDANKGRENWSCRAALKL